MLGISKATKATITYNGVELEGYMLPDGSYHLSKTDVGKAIDKYHKSVGEFISGKSPEAAPYKDYSFGELSVIGEANGSIIHSVPLEIAGVYWTYWAQRGNTKALALVSTSVVESLTRLFDTAFGVTRTEAQIQQMNVLNMDANRALFEVMTMLQSMNDRLDAQENRYQKLDEERLLLTEQKKELEDFKDDVESYPEFLYLLDSAKNELLISDFQEGVSCKEYLIEKNIPLDKNYWCTLSRRTASYYRSTKGRAPERRGSQNVYRSTDVAFIVATLRLIMQGL